MANRFPKSLLTNLGPQRVGNWLKAGRLDLFFGMLILLFLCHEFSLFHLFSEEQVIRRKSFANKGKNFEFGIKKEFRSQLQEVEFMFTYRIKELEYSHHILKTANSYTGVSVSINNDGYFILRAPNSLEEFSRELADRRLKDNRKYQVLFRVNLNSKTADISFFDAPGIEGALLSKHSLRHTRIGGGVIANITPELNLIKLSTSEPGEKLKPVWVRIVYQRTFQVLLEWGYYSLWTVFWLTCAWRLAQRGKQFYVASDWRQADLLQHKAVFVFFLMMAVYLVASIFAIYILPPHWFGKLNGFMYDPSDRFGDFFAIIAWAASKNPYINEFGWDGPVYYPLMMLLVKPLVYFEPDTLKWGVVFAGFGLAWFGAGALADNKPDPASRNAQFWLFLITLCTYPFLFAFDRGNLDLLMLLLILLYVKALRKDNWLQAGCWLGIAIAAKAYPGLFVLLALRKKDWKTPLVASLVVVLSTWGAMEIFGGEYARSWMWFQAYFRHFQNHYVLGYNFADGFNYFSDFYSLLKVLVVQGVLPISTQTLLQWYPKVGLLFIALIAYLVLFKKDEPEYLQLALIGTGVVVFPNMAYDYRLVCLLPALYSYFHRNEPHPRDRVFWVYLFAILTPKHFGLIAGKWFLSCFVNPLINFALFLWGGVPQATWARVFKAKAKS